MPSSSNSPAKLAFSTCCVSGSIAEQKEQERLAEFHRCKALRQAEEALTRSEKQAQRDRIYEAACAANQERMRRAMAARKSQNGMLPR
jgi:predicted S18 family serine protease